MADKVVWSLSVEIPGGPKFARSQSLNVEAYQKIQVTVPGEDPGSPGDPGTATISVMPAGSVAQFLLITSSLFDPAALTYKPTGGGTDFVLDGPHVLAGGAIALLGQPEELEVSNGMGPGKDAVITIIVGRDATP